MSYILDAIKKAERERDLSQFIDYSDNFKYGPLLHDQADPWQRMSVILVMTVVSIVLLLWPQEPYIVPSTTYTKVQSNSQMLYSHVPVNPPMATEDVATQWDSSAINRNKKLSFYKKKVFYSSK